MHTPHQHPPHRRQRTARLLGALSLAGVLAFAGAACTSSKSAGSPKTTDSANGGAKQGTINFRSLSPEGSLIPNALKGGSIDIAELFTFSPDIGKNGWVTLKDDKHLQAADNFVPLIRSDKNTAAVGAVIDAVDAKLTQDGLFDLVKSVAVDGANPGDVAKGWLEGNQPKNLKATGTMTVGSANFAESEIVGQIYAKALENAGVDVTFKDSIGSRQVTMPLMEKGDLDLMPEFTFSLLAYLNEKATPSNDLDKITAELKDALPKGLSVRKPTDVSDVNVFVVTPKTAKKYSLSNLSDLAKVTDDLTLGGPPECPKNAQCIPGLEKVYGLNFKVK